MTRENELLATELTKSQASGKAARRLAKELMRIRGPAAHVLVKARGDGLELVVCAPPAENEERLARRIFEMMKGAFASAGVDFDAGPMRHDGVSES